MGQALYRKHRPKSLKEVVGQEHVTETLEKALKQGRISHAYLFTGPRGVGKTSIARILAHEINELPYEDDTQHIDIIEIDAASNRRIDEIRELRDKVYVAPTSAKYKVYIIDEVHMLTREAFNALLKTLEEPPAHVVFILATTDAHKLPETIVSRTQRFGFKPADKTKVFDLLEKLAKEEGISADKAALELLSAQGQGSFRDSVSLLDQASSQGEKLTEESVRQLLGVPSTQAIESLLSSLISGDGAGLASNLDNMINQGFHATAIAKQLGELIRQQLLNNELRLSSDVAMELLAQLIETPAAYSPERFLELSLLKSISPSDTSISRLVTPIEAVVKAEPAVVEEIKEIIEAKPESKTEPPVLKANALLDEAIWPEVLTALKKRHNTLYGVVRMAQPEFTETGVKLTFAFAFHQKRINESGSQKLLSEIIEDLTGQQVMIECLLDTSTKLPAPELPPEKPKSDGELAAISNIFGGGELLES